ncbi:MAG: VanZ family protein [Candidatus Brocadia sp.]|nr:VanZ family protein [Candidatus Brocadia sp.]
MITKLFREGLFEKWARASIKIIFFNLVLILVITLYPYNFSFKEKDTGLIHYFLIILELRNLGFFDVICNILLFFPLGFGLAGYLHQRLCLDAVASLAITILISFGLSYFIEFLQGFLQSRFSSLADVFSNSIGALFGFFCFYLLKSKGKVTRFTLDFVEINLLHAFLGYSALAILISVFLSLSTSLVNWDKTFHLIFGNERTGNRPWRGYISEIYIADQAIPETEAAYAFSGKGLFDPIRDSLVALYQLTDRGCYRDKMGHLPDLVWCGEPLDVQHSGEVFLGADHWLTTAAPAEYLTERIMKHSQFTLIVTVTTADTTQSGPARIVSLSADPSCRNFTLAQQGSDLVFRLRTPLTGRNGTNPESIVHNVFSTTKPHKLVITYDGSILTIYVDDVHNSHIFEFNPVSNLISYLFPSHEFGMKSVKIFYYALMFIPFGILLAFTIKIKRHFVIQVLILCSGILLPPFLLEGITAGISGRVTRLENLFISMIFTAGPIVIFKLLRYRFVLKRSD